MYLSIALFLPTLLISIAVIAFVIKVGLAILRIDKRIERIEQHLGAGTWKPSTGEKTFASTLMN